MKRSIVVLFAIVLAGCAGAPLDEEVEAPAPVEPPAASDPSVEWRAAFDLAFTMVASGRVPQDGENCLGTTVVGLSELLVNATWQGDQTLRLVIATGGGGTIVADETGMSPLSVSYVQPVGDEHITMALLAPEGGSAIDIKAVLEASGLVLEAPGFGTAACAF